MDWEKVSEELRKPLDPKHVRPAKQFGPKGDYIEGWFAQAEANRIFGHGGWSQEVISVDLRAERECPVGKNNDDGWRVSYTAKVRITVGGVVREDCGAGHGIDRDQGLAHESALKEAVTDASKRALKSFGYPFGLALYDKERAHVGVPEPSQEDREKKAEDFKSKFIEDAERADTAAALVALWKKHEKWIAALEEKYPDHYRRIVDAYKDKMRQLDDKMQQFGDDQ